MKALIKKDFTKEFQILSTKLAPEQFLAVQLMLGVPIRDEENTDEEGKPTMRDGRKIVEETLSKFAAASVKKQKKLIKVIREQVRGVR